MIIENIPALKSYLLSNLSKLCDADPGALTKYVLALLKKNRPETELRELLLDQLDVFLGKRTEFFVDVLLEALKTKSYIESILLCEAHVPPLEKIDSSPKDGLIDPSKKSNPGSESKVKEHSDKMSNQNIPKQALTSKNKQVGDSLLLKVHAVSVTPSVIRDKRSTHSVGNDSKSLFPIASLSPLPPTAMLNSASDVPEPYNPETPGMGNSYPSYFVSTRSSSGIVSNLYKVSNENFPSKPKKACKLITVPSVNTISTGQINNNSCDYGGLKRKRISDINQLGTSKKFAKSGSVLELRKIPAPLNTIARLNRHFSKFGRILNLEIGYDDDPEAALVKFESPMEASMAYKSSDAVLNNRFIKIFYHNACLLKTGEKIEEKENPKGEISDNFLGKYAKSTQQAKCSSTYIRRGNVPHAGFFSTSDRPFRSFKENFSREVKRDDKYSVEKQLELLRKKQSLLKGSIDNQKFILAKLMKSKSKNEKQFLKEAIEKISSKINALKVEIKKDSDDMIRKLTAANKANVDNKNEKVLLDAEMDLCREGKNAEICEAVNLTSCTEELKEEGFLHKSKLDEVGSQDSQISELQNIEGSESKPIGQEQETVYSDYEEEEEDESESRSWRH